jgi:hypothetical protein
MQGQRYLTTHFCLNISRVLPTRSVKSVVYVSVLVLIAVMVALELYLAGHAHVTTTILPHATGHASTISPAPHLVEGPPDTAPRLVEGPPDSPVL